MKKVILLFLLLASVGLAQAQKYEMTATVKIWFENNDVACSSHFKLTFVTALGKQWEWYQGFNANAGQHKTFSRTFSTEPGDSIVKIITTSHRYTESWTDCTHRGGGTSEVDSLTAIYPCGSKSVNSVFPGFDGQSELTISSTPLSDVFVIEADAYLVANKDFLDTECIVSVKFSNGTTQQVLNRSPFNQNKGSRILTKGFLTKDPKNLPITQIIVQTSSFLIGPDGTKTFNVSDAPSSDFDKTFDDSTNPFSGGGPGSYIRVRYGKPLTPISYGPGVSNTLSSENDITLSIPENYNGFQWQYNIEGTVWQNVPASFGNGNSITFSGQSLLGANYRDHLFKNIFFKALYTCSPGRETETITLRHLPSAPGIVSTSTVQESCYGFNDAQIKVAFDRPLYPNENLYVFINGELSESAGNIMDAYNTVTLDNYSPGTYDITLSSLFDGQPGYSDDASHGATQAVVARPPITNFTALPFDVHCFAGEDGLITVSAQGGTGIFTSTLTAASGTTQIDLTETVGNSFQNLPAGNYTVELKDSNGCDPKDGSNNAIVFPLAINQPTEGAVLSAVESAEPLGFGLQDGHITVRAEYGTLPFTFLWTVNVSTPLVAGAPVTEGTSMTSTLSNIGKGTYHILARDNNFALAFPQTEVNVRGCYDTLSIVLDEPPLLEVILTEQHYVSCYGDSDGELVAHATGGRPYLSNETYYPYLYEWFIVQGGTPVAFGSSDSTSIDRPSSWYRIKVTDRNGIIAWSPDFKLMQPDPLKINFNTSQLLCNGDTNGTSEVLPYGGTMPYQISWSTDETNSAIQNLTNGWYSVVVTDTRGCTTYSQTEVTTPNSLDADADIVVPTCYGYSDGSIQLTTMGGTSPYQYNWQHGDQTDFAQNLTNGNYSVTIIDANNCFITREYELVQPDLLAVNLGPDRVLCTDQSLPLNATIVDPQALYAWFKDGISFASTPDVLLVDAATYRLEVTDSKGCVNTDEIKITRDNTEISADFVVATRVPRGEPVHIANISNPAPDRMEWIIPQEAFVLEEQINYVELVFNNYGEYSLGLKSFKGSCEATILKTVKVVDKSELTDYATPSEPFIKQFIVSPNPNNGNFSATVELREAGNFNLILYSNLGNTIAQKEFRSQSYVKSDFNLNLIASGTCLLQLITANGVSTIRIVIQ